jgi:hypothetical protein
MRLFCNREPYVNISVLLVRHFTHSLTLFVFYFLTYNTFLYIASWRSITAETRTRSYLQHTKRIVVFHGILIIK